VRGLNRLTGSDGILGGHSEVVAVALEQLAGAEAQRRSIQVADGRPAGPSTRSVASLDQVPGDRGASVLVGGLPRQRHGVTLDSRQTQA